MTNCLPWYETASETSLFLQSLVGWCLVLKDAILGEPLGWEGHWLRACAFSCGLVCFQGELDLLVKVPQRPWLGCCPKAFGFRACGVFSDTNHIFRSMTPPGSPVIQFSSDSIYLESVSDPTRYRAQSHKPASTLDTSPKPRTTHTSDQLAVSQGLP